MIKAPKICKDCILFSKYYAKVDVLGKPVVSGYWCCANGGHKIKGDKKQCKDRKESWR